MIILYSNDTRLTLLLGNIEKCMNGSFGTFILIFGSIGNILNLWILSEKRLRSNPCIWFFLMSSISSQFSIVFGLPSRILSVWDFDLTDTNSCWCKIQTYLSFSSRNLSLWLIMFATIDRWLLSCRKSFFRNMSSLKNARRSTLALLILSSLIYLSVFFCYDSSQIDSPFLCYGTTHVCLHLNDFVYSCVTILIPLSSMLIFGSMTIFNIRRIEYRRQRMIADLNEHSTNSKRPRMKLIDHRLLRLLLIHVLILAALIIPQGFESFYTTFTHHDMKTINDVSINTFRYNLAVLLSFCSSAVPFYIYTLFGGKLFNEALRKFYHSFCRK